MNEELERELKTDLLEACRSQLLQFPLISRAECPPGGFDTTIEFSGSQQDQDNFLDIKTIC